MGSVFYLGLATPFFHLCKTETKIKHKSYNCLHKNIPQALWHIIIVVIKLHPADLPSSDLKLLNDMIGVKVVFVQCN